MLSQEPLAYKPTFIYYFNSVKNEIIKFKTGNIAVEKQLETTMKIEKKNNKEKWRIEIFGCFGVSCVVVAVEKNA